MTRNPAVTSPWLTGITRGWNLWLDAAAPPVDPAPAWRRHDHGGRHKPADRRASPRRAGDGGR